MADIDEVTLAFIPRLLQNDADLKEVDLSGRQLSDVAAERIAQALAKNKFLRSLSLRANRIKDAGGIALAAVLRQNTTLTSLDLSLNEITDEGGHVLCEVAQTNTTVRVLNVDGTLIGEELRKQIAYWIGFNVYPTQLKYLIPQMQQNSLDVTVLDLSGDTGLRLYDVSSATLIASALRGNTAVRKCIFDRNVKGDECCAAIGKGLEENRSVTSVSFVGCFIGLYGAKALAQTLRVNSTLKEIDLSDNEIGYTGLRDIFSALQTNDVVTRIRLAGNTLNEVLLKKLDAALALNAQPVRLKRYLPRVIANDETLTALELQGEQAGGNGYIEDIKSYCSNGSAILIAEAMQYNSVVKRIDLSHNHIGPDGCAALAKMLKRNFYVTALDLRSNFITDEGARLLVDALHYNDNVVEMNMDGNSLSYKLSVELQQALVLNKQPTRLKALLPSLYEGSSDVTSVSFADFSYDAPSSGVAELNNAPRNHKHAQLVDVSIQLLCKALQYNTQVTSLNVRAQRLTDKAMVSLAEMLKSNHTIKTINIADNVDVTNEGVIALLSGLRVNDTVTDIDLGVRHKVSEPWENELKWALSMNLQPRELKQLLPKVSANDPSVRALVFKGKDELNRCVKDSSILFLVNALAMNTHVTTLDLSHSEIGNLGAEKLADWLRSNKTLWKLNLSHNEIGIDGADHIAMSLRFNRTLRALSLSHNHIMEEGARAFHDVLLQNNSLVEIDFSDCQVSPPLAKALHSVVQLNLQPGAVKSGLLRALKNDRTVLSLRFKEMLNSEPLSYTSTFVDETGQYTPDDNAADATVYCLRANQFVDTVEISGGAVGSKGCQAFAALLKGNAHLTSIDLSNNEIADDGAAAVLDTLRVNNRVIEFNLAGNKVSEFYLRRIHVALMLNKQPVSVKNYCHRLWSADQSLRQILLNIFDGERRCDDQTCELLQFHMCENNERLQCPIDTIDLSGNLITDDGCVFLNTFLEHCPAMRSVSIANNHNISDEGIRALSKSLLASNLVDTFGYDREGLSNLALANQIDAKLKENHKRTTSAEAPRVQARTNKSGRRVPKQMSYEDSPDYHRLMDRQILSDALVGRMVLSR